MTLDGLVFGGCLLLLLYIIIDAIRSRRERKRGPKRGPE